MCFSLLTLSKEIVFIFFCVFFIEAKSLQKQNDLDQFSSLVELFDNSTKCPTVITLESIQSCQNDSLDSTEKDTSLKKEKSIPSILEWHGSILSQINKKNFPNKTNFEQTTSHKFQRRFNYASVECGSKVLAANPETKEASAILVSSKDKYMLNRCSVSTRWVVIELCEEIAVDTISIANYEFFSSMFKDVRIYGANHYLEDSTEWDLIGNFTAKNVREKQFFILPNATWCRFIKFEFINHYGNEFYCPITEICVYGFTMVDDLKEQFAKDTEEIHQLDHVINSKAEKKKVVGVCALNEWDFQTTSTPEQTKITKKVYDFESSTENLSGESSVVSDHPTENITLKENQAHGKNQEPIFKTLANRIKSLELSYRYLLNLTSKYWKNLKQIEIEFEEMERKYHQLNFTMQEKFHLEFQFLEFEFSRLATEFSLKLGNLQEEILNDKSSLFWHNQFLIGLTAALVITFFYNQWRINQLTLQLESLKKQRKQSNQVIDSIPNLPTQVIRKNKSKKMKKSKSMIFSHLN